MSLHQEVFQHADDLVACTGIERLRPPVEGTDAQEHVRRFLEDTVLNKCQQLRAYALRAHLGRDHDGLNVAFEGTLHQQHTAAGKAAIYGCSPGLTAGVRQHALAGIIGDTQCQPRVGCRHQAGANFNFSFGLQAVKVGDGDSQVFPRV